MSKNFFLCFILYFVVVFNFSLFPQTKTNLEVFKELVDSSVSQIIRNENISSDVFLEVNFSPSFQVLENQVYQSFSAQNKNIINWDNPSGSVFLNYSLENAKVDYGEIFRDGFLGDQYLERKISLTGSWRLNKEAVITQDFHYEKIDTVLFSEIAEIENYAYPFTKGTIPTEPFLSNIFEPLVAVTTAAVVIALFFTIRSK